jgi:hypothetical protein
MPSLFLDAGQEFRRFGRSEPSGASPTPTGPRDRRSNLSAMAIKVQAAADNFSVSTCTGGASRLSSQYTASRLRRVFPILDPSSVHRRVRREWTANPPSVACAIARGRMADNRRR